MKETLRKNLSLILLLAFTAFYLFQAIGFPKNYARFFIDDGFNETLTVAFQILSSIFFFLIFLKLNAKKSPGRWIYLILCLFCFWVSGEELSWGQRIFNFSIPDFFLRYNDNQSANLHNLFVFAPWEDEITLTVYLGWGIFLPAVLFNWPKLASYFDRNNLPAPYPELAIGLAIGLLAEFYPAFMLKDYAEYAYEVVELFFALSLFWVGWYYFNQLRKQS